MMAVSAELSLKLMSYTSVNSDPFAFILLPLVGFVVLKWPRKSVVVDDGKKVGFFRRWMALYIDLAIVLFLLMPICLMPVLLLEYAATGVWQWNFEREAFRWSTDIPIIILFLLVFYGIYFYYKWWFVRGLQTLGQYLMGFKLVPTGETPMLSVRFLSAWIILAWWPLWPWTLFKKRDGFLWDDYSRIKAVRMRKA